MSHPTKGSDSIALLSSSYALGPRQDVHTYYDLIKAAFEGQHNVYNLISLMCEQGRMV
jgi:hypothetical protein